MRSVLQPRPVLICALSLFLLQTHAAGFPQPACASTDTSTTVWSRLLDWAKGSVTRTKWPPRLDFEDEVVLRFNTSAPEDVVALGTAVDQMHLDLWDFNGDWADIRMPKERISSLLKLLPLSLGEEHTILIQDVARAVAATYPSNHGVSDFEAAVRTLGTDSEGVHVESTLKESASVADVEFHSPLAEVAKTSHKSRTGHRNHDMIDLFFRDYQRLPTITQWMKLVDAMFRDVGLAHFFSIGKSAEGRDIPALRIGHARKLGKKRKTILVTGGLHAREWIGVSTVNYLAGSFASNYGRDRLVTKILDEFDFVFVPVLNPDGYDYTWNVDRLWRKSRQPTALASCHGLDLDHAFGYQWQANNGYESPCSENYGGDMPFQAVEAKALADWANNTQNHGRAKFVAYIDLHSYSQQILWPYAFSCAEKVPGLENMMEVAMNIAKVMRLTSSEIYRVGSACESVVAGLQPRGRPEPGGGAAIDHFFHTFGAKYSYQIKLRDTGSYGFLLPSDNIVPTGEEIFQAIKGFGDYLLGNNGIEHDVAAGSVNEDQHVMA